jgi:hypothetical protein
MADLGIAHLAGGQPDFTARGVEPGVRAGRLEPVPDRRSRRCDRVVGLLVAFAPSVKDAQHDGPRFL